MQSDKSSIYTRLLFKGTQYTLGDYVNIRESRNTDMIGQLTRIIPRDGDPNHPQWPMVKVKWYYRKSDLSPDTIPAKDSPGISDNELFDTKYKSRIYADLLNGKCKVWSIGDYEKQITLTQNDYFTRATYDIEKKEISPPIETWERMCKCNIPVNPNAFYACCDKCEQWYHPTCVGTSHEEAKNSEKFYCDECRNTIIT